MGKEIKDEYRAMKKALRSIFKAVKAKIKKDGKWKLKDIKKGFNKMKNNVQDIFRKVKRNVQDNRPSVVDGINFLSDLVKRRVAQMDFFKDILKPLRVRWLAIEKRSLVLGTARLGKKRALQALGSKKTKKKNRDREAIKAKFRAVKKALKKLLNAMKANIDKVDKFSSKKGKKQFEWIALRKIIREGFKKMKVNVRNIFRKVEAAKAFKMSDLVKDVQNVGFFEDITKPITKPIIDSLLK